METITEIIEALSEESILKCQENVEVMREIDSPAMHVRMIAYDELMNS